MIEVDSILYRFLVERFEEIKISPDLLNQVFEGMNKIRIQELKNYVLEKDVRLVYHHPRDEASLPCVALVLESTSESDQVIGQSGNGTEEIFISNMEDGWIGSDSLLIAGTERDVGVRQFYSEIAVKDGRRACRIVGKKGKSKGKGIWIDFKNSVLPIPSLISVDKIVFWIKSNKVGPFLEFGFGKDRHRERTYTVTVAEKNVWEKKSIPLGRINPSEVDKVRFMSFVILDDSEDIDIFIDSLSAEKMTEMVLEEVYLDHVYRFEIWSSNAELTLALWLFVLWCLLRYRTYLETSWGLYRQRVDGGDIMPVPEWYPEFVYIRSLSFSCTTVLQVPREEAFVTKTRVGAIEFGV